MKLIDDAMPSGLADYLEEICFKDFEWRPLLDSTNNAVSKYPSFANLVYEKSRNSIDNNLFDRLECIIWTLSAVADLNKEDLIRIRFGMYVPINHGDLHHTPHRDQITRHTVLLYYVNDTDGDTFFFNNKGDIVERVSPKKNRLVIFNGSRLHASSNPSTGYRITMNLNYDISTNGHSG